MPGHLHSLWKPTEQTAPAEAGCVGEEFSPLTPSASVTEDSESDGTVVIPWTICSCQEGKHRVPAYLKTWASPYVGWGKRE